MKAPSTDAVQLDFSADALVLKSNKLIDARQRLTLQEQRLILLLISQIRPGDESFGWFKISIAEFAKFLGIGENKKIYTELRDSVRKLMRRVVTVDCDGSDMDLNWLYGAVYGERGYVHLCLHPALKPYLLNLTSKFTKYYLSLVIHLKGIHSIRIYELLKRFEYLEVIEFDFEHLRILMGFVGNEYRQYGHFKNRVLMPAQSELSEKTDISFTVTEVKKWKKIIALRFKVSPNVPSEIFKLIPDFPKSKDTDSIFQVLSYDDGSRQSMPHILKNKKNLGGTLVHVLNLLPEQFKRRFVIIEAIQKMLEKHGEEYVARNIAYANTMSNELKDSVTDSERANYTSYLFKALDNDYGLDAQRREEQIFADLDAANKKKMDEFLARRAGAEELKAITAERQELERILENLPKEEFAALWVRAAALLPPELATSEFGKLPIRLKMYDLLSTKKI